ncbi:MAG: hypothetical protein ACYC5H_01990 [Methylovirgula sp.]
MLTFDRDLFDDPNRNSSGLWANAPDGRRVRFLVSWQILEDQLAIPSAMNFGKSPESYGTVRSRIEKACIRAFNERPNNSVELQSNDFAKL